MYGENLSSLQKLGKSQTTCVRGQDKHVGTNVSINKLQVILDYVLEHAANDERPYLEVTVLGMPISGLLDSGASHTTNIGSKGLHILHEIGLKVDKTQNVSCTVANGSRCESVGVVSLPISLKGQFRLIEALVIPDVPHLLILGIDFWNYMGIVPDLKQNEWFFFSEPVIVNTVEHVNGQSVSNNFEKSRLQAVLDRNLSLMRTTLGCITKAEHVIVSYEPLPN